MGGIMKMSNGHMHAAYSSSSSRRWKIYILMLLTLFVFGCGVLGLNDRRILNLAITQKDAQILSLHRLLQKEREQMQEMKAKTKTKLYNLGVHKMELNNKISDMHSTISSLKDELKSIELSFREKQNEAQMFKQILQRKDNEIKDLKNHLQQHANIGFVSRDDNANANRTTSETMISQSPENNTSDAIAQRISKSQWSDNQESLKLQMQGKRWRSIAKQIQVNKNSASNGEGTKEIGNKFEQGKSMIQHDIQDPITALRMQNESVLEDQQFVRDDKLDGHEKVNGKLRGYMVENNGETSIKPADAEDMSHKVAKFDISNEVENGKTVTLTNSSSARSHKGAIQYMEEDEQLKLHDTITEQAENKTYGKHNRDQGQKDVVERIEHPEDVEMGDFEESGVGVSTSTEPERDEDKDEPEF